MQDAWLQQLLHLLELQDLQQLPHVVSACANCQATMLQMILQDLKVPWPTQQCRHIICPILEAQELPGFEDCYQTWMLSRLLPQQ
jgi:bacterioferritin-associated ferredoxin